MYAHNIIKCTHGPSPPHHSSLHLDPCRALALWAASGEFPYPEVELRRPHGLQETHVYFEVRPG